MDAEPKFAEFPIDSDSVFGCVRFNHGFNVFGRYACWQDTPGYTNCSTVKEFATVRAAKECPVVAVDLRKVQADRMRFDAIVQAHENFGGPICYNGSIPYAASGL